jgi:hypothetical protein
MGFFDNVVAQQDGGGMLGGLPATWQYQNPETLTPEQKQLMALVGTQNPDKAGFNPLPQGMSPSTVFTNGATPVPGTDQGGTPYGLGGVGLPAPAPAAPIAPVTPSFGAGASPIFATPPGSTPGNPALPGAAPPAVTADDGEEDPSAANAPASPIAIGNYQMSRVGSQAAFTPDPAALPANSQPAQGQGLPGRAAAPSSGIGNLVSGYQNFMNRAADGLQSVAKGGSLLGAVRGQYDDPSAKASQVANMTARALIAKGVDPQAAIAAVQPGNTEALKTLWNQAFTQGAHAQETDKDGNIWDVNKQTGQKTIALTAKDDKFTHVQTGEGFGGQKTFGTFNTKTGELKYDAGGAGPSGAPGFGSLLAQGVQYDPNKSGSDYVAQFSPEVQSAVKAYINGDVMPTGNARKDSIATYAKTIAQKYGQDTGVAVSDATYAAKRKMQTDLASSSNSTMGGILSNGESSFKHLAEYTVSAVDQGNASHNFPFGGLLAYGQNYAGNALGGSDTQGKVKAINDNLGKYGAESTKFYAGTGGGVEERLNALKEMNATTTSGEEAAAYAEKEKSLMIDRLNTKFQEIRNTLGEERGNAEIAKHMPDIQKNIATIDANVAKLRGKEAPSAAPVPALKVGETATIGGVSIKKVSDK